LELCKLTGGGTSHHSSVKYLIAVCLYVATYDCSTYMDTCVTPTQCHTCNKYMYKLN